MGPRVHPKASGAEQQALLRKIEIGRIHVLRARLKISEDAYRDVMQQLYGKRSSTDLTPAERQRFIAHLSALVKGVAAAPGTPALAPLTARQKKMFSLWQQLADAGLVRDRRMSALRNYITGQTQVDRLEWLTSHQEATVIESLKGWLARAPAGG